jgi:ferritin-like metal-binding protein YciE
LDDRARETITKYLGDMHALESHGLQAISRQAEQLKDADHPEALSAVRDFKRTLEGHISALERRLEALGGSPTGPVKDAVSAATGVAAGLYNAVRNEEASKSVRDDYTFLSQTAIAYLMLHTTASGLGDDETKMLAERGYRDAARMVMQVDRLMPSLVLEELRQDGLRVDDVAEDCRAMVHDAWRRDEHSIGSPKAGTAGVVGR